MHELILKNAKIIKPPFLPWIVRINSNNRSWYTLLDTSELPMRAQPLVTPWREEVAGHEQLAG